MGAGLAWRRGTLQASAQLAVDGLSADDRRARYQAAVAVQLSDSWSISAEARGVRATVLAGGEGTADHVHLGARRAIGPAWLGAQCGVGRNNLKNADVADAGCVVVVGGGSGARLR